MSKSTAERKTLPAQINIQIRKGVPNVLHEFNARVDATRPAKDTSNGAKFDHDVATIDIIEALAVSLSKLVGKYRTSGTDEKFEAYLEDLLEWVRR